MVLTDHNVSKTEIFQNVIECIKNSKIDIFLYDSVRVEPTDESFKNAIKCAEEGSFDGFVAIGGGSTIDTAKAANLYSTYQDDFLTYVIIAIIFGGRLGYVLIYNFQFKTVKVYFEFSLNFY